jgi:hypothetical protein
MSAVIIDAKEFLGFGGGYKSGSVCKIGSIGGVSSYVSGSLRFSSDPEAVLYWEDCMSIRIMFP